MLRNAVAGALVLLLAQGAAAQTADCDTLLHLHGYLTVAGVKCAYREAASVVNAASACRSKIGHSAATKKAADGIRFAHGDIRASGGVASWCTHVRAQYPSLISTGRRGH